MHPRLITRFAQMGESEFLAQAGRIVSAMTDNPQFPEPWPAPAPAIGVLTATFERYRQALDASATRDQIRIAERDAIRTELTTLLQRLASYLEFITHDDGIPLRSTGFELRRSNARHGGGHSGPLDAPSGLKLSHGLATGQVELKLDRLEGAGSYEVHTAQGDPLIESNWHYALVSMSVRRILLDHIAPLQWAWVRVRGVDGQGAGRWSEPASIVVL
ncbi:fibronectin type III domain-containing protein [Leptothrix ochracea]|uniref:fibronectin type III domain-containing protein n=1 Tax=Leptothrix ochracea TaxID=735331 RepID=UPI0034E2E34A